MEDRLLSAMLHDKVAYNTVKDTIEAADLSDLGQLIFKELQEFYSNDENAPSVDSDIILSRLRRKYPEQSDTFALIVESLAPVSVPNVLSEYIDVRLHALGRRISTAISSNISSSTISELMQEYEFLREKGEAAFAEDDDGVYIGTDLDDIFSEMSDQNLVRIYPDSLNDALDGGVPRGSHIVILARPESGKSMFTINLTAKFLEQGLRVLYVGNEDPAPAMRLRILNNMTGRTRREIIANREAVHEEASAMGHDNLIFASLSPGSVSDIRRLVHRYKPDVFIVDQIRNLSASRSLTKVESLEYTAQSMRNLGKETKSLAISVTQAGDSASNKLILEMGDVDFSNTGIPSTADLMIGIGVNSEYERNNRRMLSLPKNKTSGSHAAIPIAVEPSMSRVNDV